MKNIYIDWNLYSILKAPVSPAHKIVQEFITENKEGIRLLYSPAHLEDLKQTSKLKKATLYRDLEYLSRITDQTCIVQYFGSSGTQIENRDAKEFYEANKRDSSGNFIKLFTFINRLLLNRYGYFRKIIRKRGTKTEPTEICNYSIEQLEELIIKAGISDSLEKFLHYGITLRSDNVAFLDYYYSAYTSLDLINFFPDKMKEDGDFENLKNDATHSAYGALCDAFITNDNKCYHKSKFLFKYYKTNSKLIKTCKVNNLEHLKQDLDSIIN